MIGSESRGSLLRPPTVPHVDARDRVAHARLAIAVVDALPNAPIAPYLSRGARWVRARVVLRHKPGFDLGPGTAASHPDVLLDATRALLASLPDHDTLIAEGAAFLACLAPRFAILGTASPSLLALDPDVRAQRDRFDLVLYDFRAGVLDRIVSALAPV